MKYVVKVEYWNIDMEYEWYAYHVVDKIPDRDWLKSLYDGVNEAVECTIIGKLSKCKENGKVVTLYDYIRRRITYSTF